jgi:hypothetical protein
MDHELLLRPEVMFSKLTMFLCTFEAKIGGLTRSVKDFIDQADPEGDVKVLNSNYGHKSVAGYENYIKTVEQKEARKNKNVLRRRKLQGDGTCFNSAIESVIYLEETGKVYKTKFFTTKGGIVQIPGVTNDDLSDGNMVADKWRDFLRVQFGDEKIEIAENSSRPIMMNFKFELLKTSGRIRFNLLKFSEKLRGLDEKIPAPFPVKEIKYAVGEEMKLSFKFLMPDEKTMRVNVFLRGKINILGAKNRTHVNTVYKYFCDLFVLNWSELIKLKPVPDAQI